MYNQGFWNEFKIQITASKTTCYLSALSWRVLWCFFMNETRRFYDSDYYYYYLKKISTDGSLILKYSKDQGRWLLTNSILTHPTLVPSPLYTFQLLLCGSLFFGREPLEVFFIY
jgi:hypothetical protein